MGVADSENRGRGKPGSEWNRRRAKGAANSTNTSFRAAASTETGRVLLGAALEGFFTNEQLVVAQGVYRDIYPQFGGLTGEAIVARDFDDNPALQLGAQAFGAIRLGNRSATFTGRLSNVSDRLAFTRVLATNFVRAYTNPIGYQDLRQQVTGPGR